MPLAEKWLFDHSPHMLNRWREFLEEKYATNEALREAHDDPDITFETVMVPTDKLRGSVRDVSELLYWQSGADNVVLRDYFELVAAQFFRNRHERQGPVSAQLTGWQRPAR